MLSSESCSGSPRDKTGGFGFHAAIKLWEKTEFSYFVDIKVGYHSVSYDIIHPFFLLPLLHV